jgi:hypothetical protein
MHIEILSEEVCVLNKTANSQLLHSIMPEK